jgi:flagellar protein FlaG
VSISNISMHSTVAESERSVAAYQIEQQVTQQASAMHKIEDTDTARATKISAKELSTTADKTKERDESKPSKESLTNVSEVLAKSLQQVFDSTRLLSSLQERRLEFSSSEEMGQVVVKVYDANSNEVIRQIPSEEFIRVAKKISELAGELNSEQGLLFESKV